MFGRVTYEMMASYWPTPLAAQNSPEVAEAMNRLPKIVVSRTLQRATWSNTQLIKGDLVAEVAKLKALPGPPMVILGSGNIVAQLAAAGLVDEFQFVINPIVLGQGKTPFAGLERKIDLVLTSSRAFANGNVYVCYRPG